jgi:hypothetical protein
MVKWGVLNGSILDMIRPVVLRYDIDTIHIVPMLVQGPRSSPRHEHDIIKLLARLYTT